MANPIGRVGNGMREGFFVVARVTMGCMRCRNDEVTELVAIRFDSCNVELLLRGVTNFAVLDLPLIP